MTHLTDTHLKQVLGYYDFGTHAIASVSDTPGARGYNVAAHEFTHLQLCRATTYGLVARSVIQVVQHPEAHILERKHIEALATLVDPLIAEMWLTHEGCAVSIELTTATLPHFARRDIESLGKELNEIMSGLPDSYKMALSLFGDLLVRNFAGDGFEQFLVKPMLLHGLAEAAMNAPLFDNSLLDISAAPQRFLQLIRSRQYSPDLRLQQFVLSARNAGWEQVSKMVCSILQDECDKLQLSPRNFLLHCFRNNASGIKVETRINFEFQKYLASLAKLPLHEPELRERDGSNYLKTNFSQKKVLDSRIAQLLPAIRADIAPRRKNFQIAHVDLAEIRELLANLRSEWPGVYVHLYYNPLDRSLQPNKIQILDPDSFSLVFHHFRGTISTGGISWFEGTIFTKPQNWTKEARQATKAKIPTDASVGFSPICALGGYKPELEDFLSVPDDVAVLFFSWTTADDLAGYLSKFSTLPIFGGCTTKEIYGTLIDFVALALPEHRIVILVYGFHGICPHVASIVPNFQKYVWPGSVSIGIEHFLEFGF